MSDFMFLDDYDREVALLEQRICGIYDGKSELAILEAGCGRRWPLNLGATKFKLVGVDLDEAALHSRVTIAGDLDEAIVGDLEELDLGGRRFDVIYSAYVLEHSQHADRMLENLDQVLNPGGLLILLFPDRDSVFGFVTRSTPFWFHVLYKKYIEGQKNAGKPGFDPYPTYYHEIVSRKGIRKFCREHGFTINDEISSNAYLNVKGVKTYFIRAVAILISALSLGKLPWKHNNLIYVLKKD